MTTKKTASKEQKLNPCHFRHNFTDFGIPQPANGDKVKVCLTCHETRITVIAPREETPQYTPPVFAGDMQSLWDMPIPEKLVKREQRAKQRKANKAQRI